MEKGNYRKIDCENCTQKSTISVNKFYAKKSKLIIILAGIVFLVGTFIGLYFLVNIIIELKTYFGIYVAAYGLLIPIWIYSILNDHDRDRVIAFNQTYVSE